MLNLLRMADLSNLARGPFRVRMPHSDATGHRLFKYDSFGADLIRFPAGGSVPDHTHIGDHILYVLSGDGWLNYDGMPHELTPGIIYLVPGMVRHGIRAETELTLLAIANVHRDIAAEERLSVVAQPPPYPRRPETMGRTGGGRPHPRRTNDDDGED